MTAYINNAFNSREKKSRNPSMTFSCSWEATHSKIDEFFYLPPKYYFRLISLVVYTLLYIYTLKSRKLALNKQGYVSQML